MIINVTIDTPAKIDLEKISINTEGNTTNLRTGLGKLVLAHKIALSRRAGKTGLPIATSDPCALLHALH